MRLFCISIYYKITNFLIKLRLLHNRILQFKFNSICLKFNNNWINLIYKWRHLPPLRSLASCVDGDAWVFIARSLELTAIKLSLSSPINYYQPTFYYSSSKRRRHVKYIQTYWLKFQWRISNWFQYVKCKKICLKFYITNSFICFHIRNLFRYLNSIRRGTVIFFDILNWSHMFSIYIRPFSVIIEK